MDYTKIISVTALVLLLFALSALVKAFYPGEKKEITKKISGTAFMIALVVALQFFSNYVAFGPVSINLAVIPLTVGAIIYGPWTGLILGLIDGAMILTAPSTIAVFMPYNLWATIVLCLVKTGVAGFVAGLVSSLLKKKNMTLGAILAAILVPLLNTGIFALGSFTLFHGLLESFAPVGQAVGVYLFVGFIGWNFFVEFGVCAVLSPTIASISRIYQKRFAK